MTVKITQHLLSEFRREFVHWKSYAADSVTSLLMWIIVYPLMVITIQSTALDNGIFFTALDYQASIIGFVVWHLTMSVLVATPNIVQEEARTGTLEQVFLTSSIPLVWVFLFRIMGRSVRAIVEALIFAIILGLLFSIVIPFKVPTLLVLLITLFETWGVALALAGLALIYKSLGTVASLLSTLSLLFGGALVPLNGLGKVFLAIKYLWPTSWSIDLLRDIVVSKYSLTLIWANGSLIGLSVQAAVFILIGFVCFNFSLRRVLEDGSLAQY